MASWTTTGDAQNHDQRFTHIPHHIDAGVASAGLNARNALQVVSEALDIQSNEHENQQQQKLLQNPNTDQDEVEQQLKTIVASDSDVSNGFVKCGRSLPYVFEATETGN